MSNSLITNYLRKHGPSRGFDVKEHLKGLGKSDEAARQQISRATGEICKLSNILPKRETFLFLKKDYAGIKFQESLSKALFNSGSAYGTALRGLSLKGGTVSLLRFAAYSGAPIDNRRNKLRHDVIVNKLISVKLIRQLEFGGQEYISLEENGLTSDQIANFETENVVISMLATWVRRMNLGSFDKVESCLSLKSPNCGGYAWDIVAPSYISGLASFEKEKKILRPGFCVADVCLGKILNEDDIKPIITKFESMRSLQKLGNLFPVIVHEGMDSKAFKMIRSKGFVVARVDDIFGRDASHLLNSLRGVFKNFAAAIVKDPEKVFDIFDRLVKLEGAALNLRGPLFEFIIGHMYLKEGHIINMREKLSFLNEKVEVDVNAKGKNQNIFIECKGLAPGNMVSVKEIDYWVEKQIPIIRKWLQKGRQDLGIHKEKEAFRFYYSGVFSDEVRKYCNSIEKTVKKYSIGFYDYNDIDKRLKLLNEKSLREILKEQFFEK